MKKLLLMSLSAFAFTFSVSAQQTASNSKILTTASGDFKNINAKLQKAGFGTDYQCVEGRQTVCNSNVIEFGAPPKPGERRNGIMATYERQNDINVQTVTIGLFLSNMNDKDIALKHMADMASKLFKELKIAVPEGLIEAITNMQPFETADGKKDIRISLQPRKQGGKVRQLFLEIYANN